MPICKACPVQGEHIIGGVKRLSPYQWNKQKLKVFERDKGICQWCNKPVQDWQLWDADHIVKRSKGGTDEMENLRLIHRYPCHRERHPEKQVRWSRNEPKS